MRFNSNTSNIYPYQGIYTSGGGISFTTVETVSSFGGVGAVNTAVIPPTDTSLTYKRYAGRGEINIYRYAELENRLVMWTNMGYGITSQNTTYTNSFGNFNETANAITSIQFIRSSSQTVTGTFYLYGVS